MNETIKEAIMLTNKTYFLEQVSKLKNEKKKLAIKLNIVEKKQE